MYSLFLFFHGTNNIRDKKEAIKLHLPHLCNHIPEEISEQRLSLLQNQQDHPETEKEYSHKSKYGYKLYEATSAKL